LRGSSNVNTDESEAETEIETENAAVLKAGESARDVIRHEDKLGVLSLKTLLFSMEIGDGEERLFSPYSHDEAVDHESLYQLLCSRRGGEVVEPSSVVGRYGEVFLGE